MGRPMLENLTKTLSKGMAERIVIYDASHHASSSWLQEKVQQGGIKEGTFVAASCEFT